MNETNNFKKFFTSYLSNLLRLEKIYKKEERRLAHIYFRIKN